MAECVIGKPEVLHPAVYHSERTTNQDLYNRTMTETQHPFDLILDRVVPVTTAHLWTGWTDPTTLMKWFCPLPYLTVECEIDLRPGGAFTTVMQSPEGQRFDNTGCFLEIEAGRRLVWTSALGAGYRPNALKPSSPDGPPSFHFTCELTFTEATDGARYHARGIHATEADRDAHAAMGFVEGWGAALDQLVALHN
jgi:uncharacterized protein YndB with AHSA1/START domain